MYHHSCFKVVVSKLHDATLEQEVTKEPPMVFFYLSNYHFPELKDILSLLSHFCSLDEGCSSLFLYYVDIRLHSITSLAEFRKLIRCQYIISYICS